MAHPVLETRGLTIRFGGHVAVDGVSAAFHAGTLTAIVGPNGAGKTTYFNLISGQLPATAGHVLLDGVDITGVGRGDARQARHRPGLPAHQPVPQPHRARERAPCRAGARRRRGRHPLALVESDRLDRARRPVHRGRQPRRQARYRGRGAAARRQAQARGGHHDGARAARVHVRRADGGHVGRRCAGDPRPDQGAEGRGRQDHPARRAQDGRGAQPRRPHRRAAQRAAGGGRRAGAK